MKEELTEIRNTIISDSLDTTLKALERLARTHHCSDELQALDSVKSTYNYLKQYLLTGYNDEKREQVYRELKANAYEISSRLMEKSLIESNRTLAQAKESVSARLAIIEDIEENFTNIYESIEEAKRENEDQESLKERYKGLDYLRKNIFNLLYARLVLTQSEETALAEIFADEFLKPEDLRLITGALMLSQQTLFDIRKFKVLAGICCSDVENDTRQYALTALVLGLPDKTETELYKKEITEAISRMSETDMLRLELSELQLQLLLCADTEETQKQINDEILPVLKKGASAVGTVEGETEDEIVAEILCSEERTEAMEQIEDSMERIRRMRENGVDIFYTGFSQTKRFPFFYSLMHWFIPFSLTQPEVASIDTGEVSPESIERLMNSQSFCDSDKYSFYFTFSKLVHDLPPHVATILKQGEISPEMDEKIRNDLSYHRLLYLQDLYRFYNLYPAKHDFHNPFAEEERLVFFTWKPINMLFDDNEHLLCIARKLLVSNRLTALDTILDNSFDDMNLSYLKLKALGAERKRDYPEALKRFKQALALEPDNPILLKKMAHIAGKMPDYALAKKLYATYFELAKDKDNTEEEYDYALCCIQTKDTQKAIDMLYKLYYLHEERLDYRQDLAWALLQGGRLDDAMKLYATMNAGELDEYARIRRAMVLWLSHDKREAVKSLRSVARDKKMSQRELTAALIRHNHTCNLHITETDLHVIADITFDNSL